MKRKKNKGAIIAIVIVCILAIVGTTSVIIISSNNTTNSLNAAPIIQPSTLSDVEDLYYPTLITNNNVSVYLDRLTTIAYRGGMPHGSFWIDSPNSNYNLSTPSEYLSNEAGQFQLKGNEYPGVYTIHVVDSMIIMLGENSISNELWGRHTYDWNLTSTRTAFDIGNFEGQSNKKPVIITVESQCNASIYVFNDELELICSDSINSSSLDIHPEYAVVYYILIVCESESVGKQIHLSYVGDDSGSTTGDLFVKILIIVIILSIALFAYLKYLRD